MDEKPKTKNQKLKNNNQQPKLKVCGLTDLSQVSALCEMGVDFLGFIFYEKSPRYALAKLSLEEIKSVQHQAKVGVFVNEAIEEIVDISEKADLSFVQLHGDENNDFISNLRQKLNENIKIIKVIRIGNHSPEELQKTINHQLSTNNYLLFDTDSIAFGGTGQSFDWNILNRLVIPKPYFLSGGIAQENIDQLKTINQKPFALDINSKFEIEPGVKDLEKIKDFKDKF